MKLFKIEELKESQPAACGQGLFEAEASIMMDTALGAGVVMGVERFDTQAFDTLIAHDYRSDL